MDEGRWNVCTAPDIPDFSSQSDQAGLYQLQKATTDIVCPKGLLLDQATGEDLMGCLDQAVSALPAACANPVPRIVKPDNDRSKGSLLPQEQLPQTASLSESSRAVIQDLDPAQDLQLQPAGQNRAEIG